MFFVLILIIFCTVAFYNCYWKRRNLPPGPMPWPFIGNVLLFRRNEKHHPPYDVLNGCRQRYGDVFTIWMGELPEIYVCEFALIRDCFVKDGDAYSGRVHFPAISKLFRGGDFGVVFTDGEKWRTQRRFTFAVLRDFGMGKNLMENKIINELEDLFQTFDRFAQNDEGVLIGRHLDICVGSIISALLFGFRYDESCINDFDLLKNSISEQMGMLTDPKVVLLLWKTNFFKQLPSFAQLFRRLLELRDILFNYIDDQVEKHLADFSPQADSVAEPKDFIEAYLLEMRRETSANNGESIYFTRDQLRNVVLDLLIVGQDTTALTLGFTILYVLHNSDVQTKIHNELDALSSEDGASFISTADKARLPYLNAVLNESQRMTNLLPQNLLHRTTRNVKIFGYNIPENTIITPQISCVLYDEKIFPQPHSFKPERFLDEEGNLKRIDELIPFSVGKRVCIGENLAKMELFLIIGNIFKRYKIKPMDEKNLPSLEKLAALTVHYHPYKCKLERRANL